MSNRKESTYCKIKVIQNSDRQWGVTDLKGNVIVPFGKYGWIDGFDSGLARVCDHGAMYYHKNIIGIIDFENDTIIEGDAITAEYDRIRKEKPDYYSKWGIINESGEEVLPLEYDEIWKFYGKNRLSTKVVKDGVTSEIYFHTLNPNLSTVCYRSNNYMDDGGHSDYGEFAGSYAQDVMDYSDDDINDAFDGDPDAYWNID